MAIENILEEANRITHGERNKDYGDPIDEHQKIADYWNVFLAHKLVSHITAADVARLMILLKVAREGYTFKRDNLVDIAGYAHCAERIENSMVERELIFTKSASVGFTTADPNLLGQWARDIDAQLTKEASCPPTSSSNSKGSRSKVTGRKHLNKVSKSKSVRLPVNGSGPFVIASPSGRGKRKDR